MEAHRLFLASEVSLLAYSRWLHTTWRPRRSDTFGLIGSSNGGLNKSLHGEWALCYNFPPPSGFVDNVDRIGWIKSCQPCWSLFRMKSVEHLGWNLLVYHLHTFMVILRLSIYYIALLCIRMKVKRHISCRLIIFRFCFITSGSKVIADTRLYAS